MIDKIVKGTLCILFIFGSSYASAGLIGTKWGDPVYGTGASISWSLMDTGISCRNRYEPADCTTTALAEFMPAEFKSEIERAFDAWSAVANLSFFEVEDDGSALGTFGATGDIRIAGHIFDGANGVLAHGYFPSLGSSGGDIHFDIAEMWDIGFDGFGFDIFQVMVHELGHALGLGHSDDGELLPDLPGGPALMDPYYVEFFSGPQADDIAYIQHLYGVPLLTEVPEPSTFALMLLAVLGFKGRRSKKIRAKALTA